jgi:hypothetical protein
MKAPRNRACVSVVIPDAGDTEDISLETATWPCPGLAPHPPPPTDDRASFLEWTADKPTKSRTLEYTCSCQTTVYEFLASGGNYRIRRKDRAAHPREMYAGPWRRQVAERMWALILTGEARLCSYLTPDEPA